MPKRLRLHKLLKRTKRAASMIFTVQQRVAYLTDATVAFWGVEIRYPTVGHRSDWGGDAVGQLISDPQVP